MYMLSFGDTSMLQIWCACAKEQRQNSWCKYNFNIETNGHYRIGIIIVRVTLSHGDTPMCLTWYANIKAKK